MAKYYAWLLVIRHFKATPQARRPQSRRFGPNLPTFHLLKESQNQVDQGKVGPLLKRVVVAL